MSKTTGHTPNIFESAQAIFGVACTPLKTGHHSNLLSTKSVTMGIGLEDREQIQKLCHRLNSAFERDAASNDKRFFFYAQPADLTPGNSIEFRYVDTSDVILKNRIEEEKRQHSVLLAIDKEASKTENEKTHPQRKDYVWPHPPETKWKTRFFAVDSLKEALVSVQHHMPAMGQELLDATQSSVSSAEEGRPWSETVRTSGTGTLRNI